jgi:hypothetical protein
MSGGVKHMEREESAKDRIRHRRNAVDTIVCFNLVNRRNYLKQDCSLAIRLTKLESLCVSM